MLEIVFSKGKVGTEAVKVFMVYEKSKLDLSLLPKDEQASVAKAMRQDKFEGKKGQSVEVLGGKSKVIVAGMGKNPTEMDWQKLGGAMANRLSRDSVVCFVIEEAKKGKMKAAKIANEIAFGAMIGSYRFDKYFTKKKPEEYPALEQIILKLDDADIAAEAFKPYAALANAVRYGRDLCNEPANYLTPQVFADDIDRLKYLGLDVEILGKKELEEKGFGLLLGVAQGSDNEPKVAILQWKGKPDQEEFDTALVGKGVTFDSGGISIKPSAGMDEMKCDMTGAAVVVASLKTLALQAAPVNVVGIVGLVENMPSGGALRPGDILTSLSGQTVEVLNTDAEGRLVLADCLTYVQDVYGVKEIIDIATLTGTTMRTFDGVYAAIFSNNDDLACDLMWAGDGTQERLWRMPINKAYDKRVDSAIADLKHLSKGGADCSVAACFLQRFVKEGVRWAHLDIAGMELLKKDTPLCPKGATAFGVRLLNKYLTEK